MALAIPYSRSSGWATTATARSHVSGTGSMTYLLGSTASSYEVPTTGRAAWLGGTFFPPGPPTQARISQAISVHGCSGPGQLLAGATSAAGGCDGPGWVARRGFSGLHRGQEPREGGYR